MGLSQRRMARLNPRRSQVPYPPSDPHSAQRIVLIVSLGGAVSAHIAANSLLPTLCLCVIDVVEGSAMDALQSMQTYLSSRPRTFKSLEQGIQWHIHSRTIRNRESARVSVPPLLLQTGNEWIWRTDLAKTRPFWEGTPRAPRYC